MDGPMIFDLKQCKLKNDNMGDIRKKQMKYQDIVRYIYIYFKWNIMND